MSPRAPGQLLRRWLGTLALVGGTLSSELANPWACRLVKPAQASTRPLSTERRRDDADMP
jgi:hypothetical protein